MGSLFIVNFEGINMTEHKPGWRSKVTRQDRAIDDDHWITAFLHQAATGTVATVCDGQPFLSTLLFVYDGTKRAIYFHAARQGRLWENLQAGPQGQDAPVCFTASEMGRLLPARTAYNFSVEYQSVVVFGSAHLVETSEEAAHAMQMLLDKYFPHLQPDRDYQPSTPAEIEATAVYRIDIEEWSGKRKAAAADFPGAFYRETNG